MPIRVSVVEDDDRVRESLGVLLNGTPGFECVGSHSSAEAAIQAIMGTTPDVVLMDINLPRMTGTECVEKLRAMVPELLVMMLTAFEDDDLIFHALSAGAMGYLVKQTPPSELLDAIRDLVEGGAPMSASIARKVISSFHTGAKLPGGSPGAQAEGESLSRREAEILDHLARGYYYKEIAESLGVSFETVHTHIRRIYLKLHVRSRSEAITRYRQL